MAPRWPCSTPSRLVSAARHLLGRPGLAVVGLLWVLAALLIRTDADSPRDDATAWQTSLSLLAALALAAVALSPAGRARPVGVRDGGRGPGWTFSLAALALVVLDMLPFTWLGLPPYLLVVAVAGGAVRRASRRRDWGVQHVTALAVAAVMERTLVGFLAPLPAGVGLPEKIAQSLILLALAGGVSIAGWRRASAAKRVRPVILSS